MPALYVALDLETTGLDPARDAIIEVGAVKFDGERELDRFSSLVRPGRQIPIQVSQLTGLTDRDLLNAPPFAALREKLSLFVGQAVVVGHNVSFDLGFLRKQSCLTHNASLDTFSLATILMPHESRYSLGKLMESLGLPFETQHRALDDAVATMLLFNALRERAAALPGEVLAGIVHAARKSRWPLQSLFREAERQQARAPALSGGPVLPEAGGRSDARPIVEPLRPADPPTPLDVDALAAMLEEEGALSRAFAGYEHRPQQVEMLRAVAEAFNQKRHLLVEAGTGVGKSIAYLLPAIYWGVQNGERVVVSTNTINLQDQLYGKDIPDLRELLPFEVRSTLLKGRSNYVCLRRLQGFQEWLNQGRTPSNPELDFLAKVLVWLPLTRTGDRSELVLYGARAQEMWALISSQADSCTAPHCPHLRRGGCFFYRARRAAESAHVIVVNHALLLSDVATENRVLPAYDYLIVDEAHHLESATTYQLGHSTTMRGIFGLLGRIGRRDSVEGGYLGRVLGRCQGRVPGELLAEMQESVGLLQDQVETLIAGLGHLFEGLALFVDQQQGQKSAYDQRLRLSRELRLQPEWEQIEVGWVNQAEELESAIGELAHLLDTLRDVEGFEILGYDDLVQDGSGYLQELGVVYRQLESVLMASHRDEIAWIRTRPGKARGSGEARDPVDELALSAVPLRVDDLVEEHLLRPKKAAVFSSATLRTNGDFTFIKERLGAQDAEELAVGSPFDYESQVLLYLPTDIPEPNQPYHQQSMNQSLLELACATQGRLLALFTSYHQLRSVSKAISRPLATRGITVYAQGQGGSRSQLLENFRDTPRSVLLGTRSFWEGVDVPGDPLSCLVLAKLPFAVPSDPIFAARSEEMDDPFYQYMVPDAILRFRQGFGRLIRSKTDRGVAVLMDRRLQTKRYGELFLASLPPCTVVRGPLADLPQSAALWIDEGLALLGETEGRQGEACEADNELEYVSFDDLD